MVPAVPCGQRASLRHRQSGILREAAGALTVGSPAADLASAVPVVDAMVDAMVDAIVGALTAAQPSR